VPASTTVRAAAALLLAALVGAVMLVLAAPAEASCVGNPQPSPYRFTGVVLGTELAQRIAYVATDDGRSVMVRGTESTADDAFTTVDRTYVTGHRYVFHPVNSTSPYDDNICTATLDLGPAPSQPEAVPTTAETELADGSDAALAPRAWLLTGAVVGVVLLSTGVVLVRRSRPQTSGPDADPMGS
jgi:hypothetical protein